MKLIGSCLLIMMLGQEPDLILNLLVRSDLRGAMLFFLAPDDAAAKRISEEIPVIQRGYGEYQLIKYENFVSVQRLFGQGGKYIDNPVQHEKPLRLAAGPSVSFWLTLETSNTSDISYVWRMKKGGVARTVYSMVEPSNGLLLDVFAEDELHARDIVKEIPSIKTGEAEGKWSIYGGFPAALYDVLF
ncbi:hypothetical protein ColTof4_04496 [Colletotrichum tofieldiae]|nr:hypothetical protein ColTof4_04496 [Colletotrichum tofieldiae]GKT90140.1 hypothetical protein Ct61P_07990 [Colletotrichum tofieldiae]